VPTCSISHVQRNAQLKMSGRAIWGEGAVKRQRQQEQEEDEPALLESESQTTAHPKPLTLLALVKTHFDTLVWMHLCDPQGVSLFSFVRLPPRVLRPFAGAAVHDMSLTHAERLCAVGCGLKGKLVRLVSLGIEITTTSTTISTTTTTTTARTARTSTISRYTITITDTVSTTTRYVEPDRPDWLDWRACHKLMQSIARRVASKRMAAVRDEAAKEAEELCASGRCAAAVVPLQRAIDFGDFTSLALKAWLLIDGREGIAEDEERGFELAEEGARLGCHHCQGVVAYCYCSGFGCEDDEARSLSLARESSGRGSRYGQYTLGELIDCGSAGLAQYDAAAFWRLAAAQGLDGAQHSLGLMYFHGNEVARDYAEALRWFHLAAAQGYPSAFFLIADCHENGRGVAADVAEAIRWYRRAQAAGDPYALAARRLHRLGA
jgi:hypothetical protein